MLTEQVHEKTKRKPENPKGAKESKKRQAQIEKKTRTKQKRLNKKSLANQVECIGPLVTQTDQEKKSGKIVLVFCFAKKKRERG